MTPDLSLPRRQFLKTVGAGALLLSAAPWLRAAKEPTPTRKLGVVLVGLGNYSANQLAPALKKSTLCRLVGVVTGKRAKGLAWAKEHGFPESQVYSYETMHLMKGNPDIDLVYVVTPPGLHVRDCVAAAGAGKHVICEKPMARTAAECDTIIEACKTAGVRLFVGYRLHYEPRTLEFIRLANQAPLSPLMKLEAANGFRVWDGATPQNFWRIQADLAGGGPLMDMGVYVIQGVCMAKGEQAPIAVEAEFAPVERPHLFSEVEEGIRWTMEFADGAKATCETSYARQVGRFAAEGPGGWIRLEGDSFGYGSPDVVSSVGKVTLPKVHHQLAQFEGMARELRENLPSAAPGEMGRRDLKIIEAIYRSAREKRRIAL